MLSILCLLSVSQNMLRLGKRSDFFFFLQKKVLKNSQNRRIDFYEDMVFRCVKISPLQ